MDWFWDTTKLCNLPKVLQHYHTLELSSYVCTNSARVAHKLIMQLQLHHHSNCTFLHAHWLTQNSLNIDLPR